MPADTRCDRAVGSTKQSFGTTPNASANGSRASEARDIDKGSQLRRECKAQDSESSGVTHSKSRSRHRREAGRPTARPAARCSVPDRAAPPRSLRSSRALYPQPKSCLVSQRNGSSLRETFSQTCLHLALQPSVWDTRESETRRNSTTEGQHQNVYTRRRNVSASGQHQASHRKTRHHDPRHGSGRDHSDRRR